MALVSIQPLTGIFLGEGGKGGLCIILTISPQPVSRLVRKYGSLDVSQSDVPPRPCTKIALPYHLLILRKELHDLYSSPSIIRIIKSRRMRWAGHEARMGEKRNAYRVLVGKPEGKRPLERPRRRWVDNIRMDLGELGWGNVDWIDLAQEWNRWRALVNSVLNLRVP
jgi:hypothetical protein